MLQYKVINLVQLNCVSDSSVIGRERFRYTFMEGHNHSLFTFSLFCVCLQEKERALQMWQAASQELDRLQTQHQSSISDGQRHAVERQHMQVTVFTYEHFHVQVQSIYNACGRS